MFSKANNTTDVSIRQDLSRCEKIQGNVLVRIYESDGSVIEENMAVDEEEQNWQFKLDRSRKLKKKRMDESGNGESMEIESQPVKKLDSNALSWIRIDPDLDWLRKVTLKQGEDMWINQLNEDRDVVAQIEAIEGMLLLPEHKDTIDADRKSVV